MVYKEGDFVLIEDDNYKAKKFIGEIQQKLKSDYRLYVYIFPEDTIDGRLPYMSFNEVFFTPTQILYSLSEDKKKEQKVEVLSLEKYVEKKYLNEEKLEYPLYFHRQTYLIEGNKFDPDKLSTICYCKQIFNPDNPFKKCFCGNYFHPDCLLQSKTNKCWADNCDFNCDTLLSEEEQFLKSRITSGEIKEGDINITQLEKDFINKKEEQKKHSYNDSDNDSDNDNDNESDSYKDSDKDNKIKENKIKNSENEEKKVQIKVLEKENFKKYNSLKPKLKLCYNISINQIEDNKNPVIKLISNYEEINNILDIGEENIIKFLYFNRENIHKILYDIEENLDIDYKCNTKELYFYLSLLSNENSHIIDYIYSINLIEHLNEERIKEEHHKLKQIILAKIIYDFIQNYDDEDKENNNKLNLIEEDNKNIIMKNINVFKEFNLDIKTIFSEKIDEIYMDIIKNLIINQKLDDSEYFNNIIDEMGLKSINLTK